MKEIELTQGYKTIVDDGDFIYLSLLNWFAVITVTGPNKIHVSACRWTKRNGKRICIRMHQQILDIYDELIDHKNRDSLDNRRDNLRVANKSINGYNSERSINASGIYYDKNRARYKAFLLRPRKKYVGTFETYEAAKEAQDHARNS